MKMFEGIKITNLESFVADDFSLYYDGIYFLNVL